MTKKAPTLARALTLALATFGLLALFGAGPLAGVALGAAPPKVSRADVDLIIVKRGIQTETPTPFDLKELAKFNNSKPESFFPPLLTRVFFGLVVGLIIFFIVMAIIKNLGQTRKKTEPEKTEPEKVESKDLAKTLSQIKETSQNIAKGGYFAEAIHELLIKSLAEFQRRKGRSFSPALTSREILTELNLAPPVGPALGSLVSLVELSRFGRATPGEAEYKASLSQYETILASLSPRAKAS